MLTMLVAAMMIAAPSTQSQREIGADQFLRLMRSMHDRIRDVDFVYEGDHRFAAGFKADRAEVRAIERKFQGQWVCRQGKDILMNQYNVSDHHSRCDIVSYSLNNGQLLTAVERNPRSPFVSKVTPVLSRFYVPGSPVYYYTPAFFAWYNDSAKFGYEYNGWEEVDGRQCLHVTIFPVKSSTKIARQFWIDMERGGHALRIATFHDDKLTDVVTKVDLKSFRDRYGDTVWMPMSATYDQHTWARTWYKEPVLRTTSRVLETSLRVNVGIGDDAFDLVKKVVDLHPRGISREWLALVDASKRPRLRTDPSGVKEHLNKLMAEADRQARLIDASSAAELEKRWSIAPGIGLAFFGVGLLAGVAIWKWSRR